MVQRWRDRLHSLFSQLGDGSFEWVRDGDGTPPCWMRLKVRGKEDNMYENLVFLIIYSALILLLCFLLFFSVKIMQRKPSTYGLMKCSLMAIQLYYYYHNIMSFFVVAFVCCFCFLLQLFFIAIIFCCYCFLLLLFFVAIVFYCYCFLLLLLLVAIVTVAIVSVATVVVAVVVVIVVVISSSCCHFSLSIIVVNCCCCFISTPIPSSSKIHSICFLYNSTFLDAPSHLYKRSCPSVRL